MLKKRLKSNFVIDFSTLAVNERPNAACMVVRVLVCERVIGVSFPGPTLFGAARNVIATLKSNRTEGSSGTNYHRERLLPVFYEVRS